MATYNLLSKPEDLTRLTEPDDTLNCIASLSRLLCATRSSHEEWYWAVQATIAAAPDQWFELRLRGQVTGYMRAGKSNGLYSQRRPDNVPVDQVHVIELPVPPPTTLRDFLGRLGQKLVKVDPVNSANTIARATALRADEISSAYEETRNLIDAVEASFAPPLSERLVMEIYEKSLRERYLSFNLRGDIVGFMYVLTHTARAGDPLRVFSRVLREPPAADVNTIDAFVDLLLSAVMRFENGSEWVIRAAGELAQKTEDMLDRATGANSVGDFYGAIYEAVPLTYGAKRAYMFLVKATSGSQSTEFQRLANVSDERFASSVAALKVAFANSMDYRYVLAHRREIERERHLKGESAAKLLAKEYVDFSMLYPTFFRPFLLGQTDRLALSAVGPPHTN